MIVNDEGVIGREHLHEVAIERVVTLDVLLEAMAAAKARLKGYLSVRRRL